MDVLRDFIFWTPGLPCLEVRVQPARTGAFHDFRGTAPGLQVLRLTTGATPASRNGPYGCRRRTVYGNDLAASALDSLAGTSTCK